MQFSFLFDSKFAKFESKFCIFLTNQHTMSSKIRPPVISFLLFCPYYYQFHLNILLLTLLIHIHFNIIHFFDTLSLCLTNHHWNYCSILYVQWYLTTHHCTNTICPIPYLSLYTWPIIVQYNTYSLYQYISTTHTHLQHIPFIFISY